jgi:hypothetical protein
VQLCGCRGHQTRRRRTFGLGQFPTRVVIKNRRLRHLGHDVWAWRRASPGKQAGDDIAVSVEEDRTAGIYPVTDRATQPVRRPMSRIVAVWTLRRSGTDRAEENAGGVGFPAAAEMAAVPPQHELVAVQLWSVDRRPGGS